MSSKENMSSFLVCGSHFQAELVLWLSSVTRNWLSAKSNAKVHLLGLKAVVSRCALWDKCPHFDLRPADLSTARLHQVSPIMWSSFHSVDKTIKSSTREGQMDWVTHSGVSASADPSCILAECWWGLWRGRAEASEERVMADPDWQWQSGEGSLLILFDLWSEPENETEPPSKRSRKLARVSGCSQRAQVRGITHQWLLLSNMSQHYRLGFTDAPARYEHLGDV